MTTETTPVPSPEKRCPCGSGKKSKNCCGGNPSPPETQSNQKTWLIALGLLAVIGVAIYAISVNRPATVAGTSASAPAGITNPQPWQYDAASDQHWDPSHKHWHQGRPPASASAEVKPPAATFEAPKPPTTGASPQTKTGQTPAGQTPTGQTPAAGTGVAPKPWQYDAANNRHWDPGHGHWHGGPPPPQAPKP